MLKNFGKSDSKVPKVGGRGVSADPKVLSHFFFCPEAIKSKQMPNCQKAKNSEKGRGGGQAILEKYHKKQLISFEGFPKSVNQPKWKIF